MIMNRVFITGASSGIGAALAAAYAQRGAQVALVGRRLEALAAVKSKFPQDAGHYVYAVDVCDRTALHDAAADFLSGGPVDIVIACAGISVGNLTEEPADYPVFESIIETNLNGTVATFEPFIPSMKQRGQGRLVGIGSVAGVRGLPGAGAYSASKAAVRNYCESLRVELRGSGVKVITLVPGYIQTPMTARNPYRMPFLMPVDEFAQHAVRAIDAGGSYKVIPWQMAWVARILPLLPNRVYDFLSVRGGRKPRQ